MNIFGKLLESSDFRFGLLQTSGVGSLDRVGDPLDLDLKL